MIRNRSRSTIPVGGGGNIPEAGRIPGAAIYWSAPHADGWRVQAQDVFRRKTPWVLTAYVVCARGRDADTAGGALPPETVGG